MTKPAKARRRRARSKSHITPQRQTPPGAPPGTLTADPQAPKGVVRAIAYDADRFEEQEITGLDQIDALRAKLKKIWINVDGLGDVDLVRRLGEKFSLHPLALEDVLHVHQRAKQEDYGSHHFIVLRMAADGARLETEQVAIFLGRDFVITFQEDIEGDSFNAVRERLRKGVSQMRSYGSDYLAYALIDAVVDHYFPVLERFGERLDNLEDMVITEPGRGTLDCIHEMKRDLLSLRKAFWPLRDAVNGLVRDPNPLIADGTRIYLRDVYDHIVQVIDVVETYREIASGLMDVYLSSLSNRMNEVMRVLTVIATIFIPLTFIAGIYGMNFNPERSPLNMPELNWYFGYPFSLTLMVLTAGVLLLFFKRKGWLGGDNDPGDLLERPSKHAPPKKPEAAPRDQGVHPW